LAEFFRVIMKVMGPMQINDTDDFQKALASAEGKMGKTLLTDEDVLVLACREIAKTYTRDEKNYT
jgi:hypothetical protein